MNLHEHKKDFKELISIVANEMNLPEIAIEKDYLIVLLLNNLSKSDYASQCVFKGGTSLSKCYPHSIERFSEDIDLTFLGMEKSDNYCDKTIKKIEQIIADKFSKLKINNERNKRNKSMFVWYENEQNKIKLEIGSSVKPEPYSKKTFKSYIHEYLEKNRPELIEKFKLSAVTLNVLNIERTFIDKIMSVKRHALCGTLNSKVRHIYDVTRLYELDEIKTFLKIKDELKKIIKLTKETDSFYLKKRNIPNDYNPKGPYNFESFKIYFSNEIKIIYENMHNDLLYTNDKQDFNKAIDTFEKINHILKEINE